uniref:F-box domain-containing protein n=1 Tax=Oryza barthii TaxID=65489 RepID=A0A0D3HA38_9ORYZ
MESSPPLHKRLRRSSESNGERRPPRGELLVDEILTRLPIAAAVRFRAVCRQWNAALPSDHFILAHRARAAAARHRHPELLFFAPGAAFAGGRATSFYACSLRDGDCEAPPPPAAARELLTVAGITAAHAVLSPTPCRGLTLIFDTYRSEYYLFNLSTGDHVALPPCQPAAAANLDSTLTLPTMNPTGRSSSPSPSWSVRCSINLQSLPEQVSEELAGERVIVPLCSAGGGSKILLATGGHKVFVYDVERNAVERVFRMQDMVDVPRGYLQASLLLSVGLHDERIADVVHRRAGAGDGERRLKVKLGRRRDSTLVKASGGVL